ncbi:ABC-2 transporter permease [Petrotoga mobilis]|uniref:ABC-2 transporter permease n=1 Tax=Petrotoga mobilis TaxID=69499 RepID=UPI00014FBA07|nr:ABC-2 transporter permease [Petrotoga mobilis]
MVNFLNKLEVYFQKEFTEKSGRIFIFSLIFLFFITFDIPFLTLFFIFLFLTNMIGHDLRNGKFSLIISLPYSYREVFFSSYVLSLLLIVIPSSIGLAFFNFGSLYLSMALLKILSVIILATAYFAIIIISVTLGGDTFGIPFLILIVDGILGAIGSSYAVNPYKYISPSHQGNVWASLIFSVFLLLLSLYLFEKRGVQK